MGSLNGSDGVNDQHGCRCAFANEKARSKRALEFGRELLRGPRYGKDSFAEVIVVFLVVVTSTRWHEIQLAWPGNAQECMSERRFYPTILNPRSRRGPRRREANGNRRLGDPDISQAPDLLSGAQDDRCVDSRQPPSTSPHSVYLGFADAFEVWASTVAQALHFHGVSPRASRAGCRYARRQAHRRMRPCASLPVPARSSPLCVHGCIGTRSWAWTWVVIPARHALSVRRLLWASRAPGLRRRRGPSAAMTGQDRRHSHTPARVSQLGRVEVHQFFAPFLGHCKNLCNAGAARQRQAIRRRRYEGNDKPCRSEDSDLVDVLGSIERNRQT